MVNVPTVTDLESDIILGQRIELFIGDSAGSDTTEDKLTTMRNLSLDINHPEVRINHGLNRIYSHGAPDIALRFTLSVTPSVVDYLRTRGTRNSETGIIPTYQWAVKASGANSSKNIKFGGKLTQKNYTKADAQQGTPYDVQCVIRVENEYEPAAT